MQLFSNDCQAAALEFASNLRSENKYSSHVLMDPTTSRSNYIYFVVSLISHVYFHIGISYLLINITYNKINITYNKFSYYILKKIRKMQDFIKKLGDNL